MFFTFCRSLGKKKHRVNGIRLVAFTQNDCLQFVWSLLRIRFFNNAPTRPMFSSVLLKSVGRPHRSSFTTRINTINRMLSVTFPPLFIPLPPPRDQIQRKIHRSHVQSNCSSSRVTAERGVVLLSRKPRIACTCTSLTLVVHMSQAYARRTYVSKVS